MLTADGGRGALAGESSAFIRVVLAENREHGVKSANLRRRLTQDGKAQIVNHMVHDSITTLASLADPVRIGIVARLAEGDATVSALAAPYDISLQAVRKHLALLEAAGLVTSRKTGRVRLCSLQKAPIRKAVSWLGSRARLWEDRLEALADIVEARRPK